MNSKVATFHFVLSSLHMLQNMYKIGLLKAKERTTHLIVVLLTFLHVSTYDPPSEKTTTTN